MPSFLAGLSHVARTAFPLIQRGVREGLSANAISDFLSTQGLGIRRQTLLDLVRLEKGVQETVNVLRFLPLNSRPNPDRLVEALTKIRRAFSFTLEVRGFFAGTTDPRTIFVTVSTDRLLTRREMQERAERAVERNQPEYGIDVEEVLPLKGVKAGPFGTF